MKIGCSSKQSETATTACAITKALSSNALHRLSQAAQHIHSGMKIDCDYSLFRYYL